MADDGDAFDFSGSTPQFVAPSTALTPQPRGPQSQPNPASLPPVSYSRAPEAAIPGRAPTVLSDFPLDNASQQPSGDQFDFSNGQAPPPQAPGKTWRGDILPVSGGPNGVQFDPTAGIMGTAGNLASLPKKFMTGQMDPNNPADVGLMAQGASILTPGDMMAPGVWGQDVQRVLPKTPTVSELKTDSTGTRALANALGVEIDPYHIAETATGWQQGLKDRTSVTAPLTNSVLDRLQKVPQGAAPVQLSDLDNVRKELGAIAYKTPSATPTDRGAAKQIISSIDGYVANLPSEAVLAGAPAAPLASSLYTTARANDAARFNDNKVTASGNYAQYKSNGSNYDTMLKNRITPLFDPDRPQRLAGFTDTEKQALGNVATAGNDPIRQALRQTTGRFPRMLEGNASAVGAFEGFNHYGFPGAIVGAAPAIIGGAGRAIQNKLAKNALNAVSEQVRQRSPLYQERLNDAPFEMPVNASGMATIRAGTGTAQDQDQPQYAKGGAVKSKHDRLVSRLMSLADKAKAAEKSKTKNILKLPDNTVTTALAKANAAI